MGDWDGRSGLKSAVAWDVQCVFSAWVQCAVSGTVQCPLSAAGTGGSVSTGFDTFFAYPTHGTTIRLIWIRVSFDKPVMNKMGSSPQSLFMNQLYFVVTRGSHLTVCPSPYVLTGKTILLTAPPLLAHCPCPFTKAMAWQTAHPNPPCKGIQNFKQLGGTKTPYPGSYQDPPKRCK